MSITTVVNILVGLGDVILLWIVGVPYALLWGVLSWVMGYIPTVGFWIAMIPPIIVAWQLLGVEEARCRYATADSTPPWSHPFVEAELNFLLLRHEAPAAEVRVLRDDPHAASGGPRPLTRMRTGFLLPARPTTARPPSRCDWAPGPLLAPLGRQLQTGDPVPKSSGPAAGWPLRNSSSRLGSAWGYMSC